MNIFELILSDPVSYQQSSLDYVNHQSNWMLFKHNITQLFAIKPTELQLFLSRSRQLWGQIRKNSVQLVPVMIEYYMNELQKLINGPLDSCLIEIQRAMGNNKKYRQMEIIGYLQAIRDIYYVQGKYILLFDYESRFMGAFRHQVETLLQKYTVKQKIFAFIKEAYQRNCINIMQSQVLQFEETVKQYIQEKSQNSASFVLNFPQIKKMLDYLFDFNLLEEYFQPAISFFNQQSEHFIISCTDFSEGGDFLPRCLAYQRSFQKQFIKGVKSAKTQNYLGHFLNQLDDNMHYLCAKNCSKNILDIILDFPQSLSTILSFKKCLDRAPLLCEVGEHLNREVERRLLIPGVITQNILNQYINMLKVLQILDPQGLIFQKITLPIKNYLLKRNDTLRCIISHLTDDGENYTKLTRQVVKIPSKEYIQQMSSQEDQNAAKQWQILPVRENKTKIRIKYQQIDLVTVLVGLYGSQQAFICEYQNMMAEKLMSAKDYNIDEQIRNIQLLKMRFGQSALQTCNIIVKDVKDSKKNDKDIHLIKSGVNSNAITLLQLNTLAVSKGYWPINYQNNSSFQMPKDFQQVFNQYSARFSQIKAMRKIAFHFSLGHVNLTLSFDNGSFSFKCLPIQAIMITYFDQGKIKDPKNGVSSEELSTELQIPQNVVKQKMSFWVHKGVVKETRLARNAVSLRRLNSFEDGQVVYYKPVNIYENIVKQQMDDDVESSLLKESTSMESHLRHIIEGLILSILNTNGPKPSQKIHLLLKTVYKTDLDYTYGEAQTVQILKKMLQKKKINFNGEVYSSKEE